MIFDLPSRLRNRPQTLGYRDFGIWVIGLVLLIPVLYLLVHNGYSLLLGLMAVGAIVTVWQVNRNLGLGVMFGFLLLLGDIRRIMDIVTGPRGLDPLLLAIPIFTVYLALPLLMRLTLPDTISKAMFAWLVIMILGIFNPRQGPIAVGISGALYWIIPTLWFWIGSKYGSPRLMFLILYRVFVPLGLLDAILGLFQTYFGYLPWEAAWAAQFPGQYILKSGQLRPFGFSTSGVEYQLVLLIATVLVIAAVFAGRRSYGLLLPILVPAVFLSSSRGLIVRTVFAAAMLWAVRGKRGRNWLPRLAFALSLGIGLMMYSALTAAPEQSLTTLSKKGSSAQLASAHVTQGLAHPLDSKYSTGGIHAAMVWVGIVRGFTYPIGTGVGAVTLGAGKFGGDAAISGSTEVDISDAFVTMGFVGGLLYIFIIYSGFGQALRYVREGPPLLSLAVMGLLTAMLGAWVPPAYAMGPLIWLSIGYVSIPKKVAELSTAAS